MSKVAITGNASGTGVFTVASPNSNVDRVLTLPDETGTVDTLQRSGNVLQVVNFQTGAVASGTTVIPSDTTIPQITEGDQYMSLAITPTNANNILVIEVDVMASISITDNIIGGLFKDALVDALAAAWVYEATATGINKVHMKHALVAGSTALATFRVRLGSANVGTLTFNGHSGTTQVLGTTTKSSITITEYTP